MTREVEYARDEKKDRRRSPSPRAVCSRLMAHRCAEIQQIVAHVPPQPSWTSWWIRQIEVRAVERLHLQAGSLRPLIET